MNHFIMLFHWNGAVFLKTYCLCLNNRSPYILIGLKVPLGIVTYQKPVNEEKENSLFTDNHLAVRYHHYAGTAMNVTIFAHFCIYCPREFCPTQRLNM